MGLIGLCQACDCLLSGYCLGTAFLPSVLTRGGPPDRRKLASPADDAAQRHRHAAEEVS